MRPDPDAPAQRSLDLQTDRPHPARVYDYLLGGKDNFPADRAAAEEGLKAKPGGPVTVRQNRDFMRRAVRWLAGEAGVDRFLDIGTGLPTAPNVHETAQAVRPGARVVYVDNDPIVLTHARALLQGTAEGRTAYLEADLRDPEAILNASLTREVLGLDEEPDRPIGLLLVAVLHHLQDEDAPAEIVRRLTAALPSGSYLVLSHVTADFAPEEWEAARSVYREHRATSLIRPRPRARIAGLLDGLEPVDPGLRLVHKWRPDAGAPDPSLTPALVSCYGAVARVP